MDDRNLQKRRSGRISRRLCAPPGARYQTFGRTVYDIPELLEAIATEMTWASLVKFGNSSNYARGLVYSMIRKRIFNLVKPFLPDPAGDFDLFFKFLRLTNGGIMGSFAWSVMATEHKVMPINDLNLVVPNGGLRVWHWMEFLTKIGYTTIYYRHDWGSRMSSCRRTLTFHSERCIKAEYSSTNLPSLARRGINLLWRTSTPEPTEACKDECTGVWRRTKGLPGVGIARWGGTDMESREWDILDAEEELGRTNQKYRIGYQCENQECPNFGEFFNSYDLNRRRLR
ncbi:hypothetical protein GALMADRAFT_214198 [Galerina marginata CBS 339.88]|uniref:Uncharacterized protein n=1 Tax=Galerina marginata (strain CBS 339.88) TaxID=685588 RepID=A0A067SSY5_GALM3|nr:hypothetical protein GALMADRAFT_214198 [Galerina marginata CBS 339.88]